MTFLCTTDNNWDKAVNKPGVLLKNMFSFGSENTAENFQGAYNNLSRIANAPLSELVAKNPNLVVFPEVLGQHKDGIEKLPVFTLSGAADESENARLTTGNLMGFVGVGSTQVKITSRFTPDSEDYFLYYMLEKVFALNLFDLEHLSSRGNFDFFYLLFPHFLRRALTQGLYKTYRTEQKNDANIKGAVDVSRYIRENIPFRGKISYNTRERTSDNDLTELVRHTIEVLKTNPLGRAVLFSNDETRRAVDALVGATPSYKYHEREKIIAKNAKSVNHPYFTQWKPLQKICLAILRHQKLQYGSNSREVYGVLFDGAWLWEEYLATVLTKCGFKHPRNKESSGGISLWNGNTRYPDFYRGNQIKGFKYGDAIPEENFILDAKYKRINTASIDRDDAHQIVTYMHILPAKRSGLIYPYPQDEKSLYQKKFYEVQGFGGTVQTFGFPIPQKAQGYKEFAEKMGLTERDFEKIINKKYFAPASFHATCCVV